MRCAWNQAISTIRLSQVHGSSGKWTPTTQEKASEQTIQLKSVFLPESFCALTKTLPFRLSLDFDSEPERPKLNIDFHFLDLVDNFLLEGKKAQVITKP